MIKTNARFKDALWLPIIQSHHVTIGGAGGIGSALCFLLSRIGPKKITIYDNDTMDYVNLSNQFVRVNDANFNISKVKVAQELALAFSNYTEIEGIEGEFTSKTSSSEVMFSCFDNMEARLTMFNVFKQNLHLYENPIFIDGRLTAEDFNVYAVTKDKLEQYEKTLFPDSEAAPLPCGFKGTSHNSFMIASKMIALYTNFSYNLAVGESIREVPFGIENSIFSMTEEIIL